MICTDHQIYSGDEIEKNEMGWACSTYGDNRGFGREIRGKETSWQCKDSPSFALCLVPKQFIVYCVFTIDVLRCVVCLCVCVSCVCVVLLCFAKVMYRCGR